MMRAVKRGSVIKEEDCEDSDNEKIAVRSPTVVSGRSPSPPQHGVSAKQDCQHIGSDALQVEQQFSLKNRDETARNSVSQLTFSS